MFIAYALVGVLALLFFLSIAGSFSNMGGQRLR